MVNLKRMTITEFNEFRAFSVENYAKALARNLRMTFRDALEVARKESTEELPQGFYSEGHHFFHIEDPAQKARIGYAWVFINVKRKNSFLYDIWINEGQRGKGYAKEALEELSDLCKKQGVKTLRLNVFADNKQARQLYEKLGFEPCNIIMQRLL